MKMRVLESPIADSLYRKQIMSFIHGDFWHTFFDKELSERDKYYKHRHIIMEDSGKIIAHCHICISIKHIDFAQFTFLEVHKNFQGCGLAQKIYNKAMELLKYENVKFVFLETDFQNIARKHIYLKDGFTDIFISPEGRVAMVKSWKSSISEYLSRDSCPIVKQKEYAFSYSDYSVIDIILNIKLNQMSDKKQLPLNAYGKKGAYCLFRDKHLVDKIKAYTHKNKIVDVELLTKGIE